MIGYNKRNIAEMMFPSFYKTLQIDVPSRVKIRIIIILIPY